MLTSSPDESSSLNFYQPATWVTGAYCVACGLSAGVSFAFCLGFSLWLMACIAAVVLILVYKNRRDFQGKYIIKEYPPKMSRWIWLKAMITILLSPLFLAAFVLEKTVMQLVQFFSLEKPLILRYGYLAFYITNDFVSSLFTVIGFGGWLVSAFSKNVLTMGLNPLGWILFVIYWVSNFPFSLATEGVSNIQEMRGQSSVHDPVKDWLRDKGFIPVMAKAWKRWGYRLWGVFWHTVEHVVSIVGMMPPEWVLVIASNPALLASSVFVVLGMFVALFVETYYFDGGEFYENGNKALADANRAPIDLNSENKLAHYIPNWLVPAACFLHAIADTFPILVAAKFVVPLLGLAAAPWAYVVTVPAFLAIGVGLYYSEWQVASERIVEAKAQYQQQCSLPEMSGQSVFSGEGNRPPNNSVAKSMAALGAFATGKQSAAVHSDFKTGDDTLQDSFSIQCALLK